jgi:hypothetical protein
MKIKTAALLMLYAGLPTQLAIVAWAQTAPAAAAMNPSAADGRRNSNEGVPQRMLSLLLSDARLREIAGGSAQQRVRQHYLWGKVAKEIAAVYADLMSPARKQEQHSAARSTH